MLWYAIQFASVLLNWLTVDDVGARVRCNNTFRKKEMKCPLNKAQNEAATRRSVSRVTEPDESATILVRLAKAPEQ